MGKSKSDDVFVSGMEAKELVRIKGASFLLLQLLWENKNDDYYWFPNLRHENKRASALLHRI